MKQVDRILAYGKENFVLNTDKTKELILDFRKKAPPLQTLEIKGAVVERVHNFKFLGLHITNTLSWSENTMANVKKAQQRLYFIRSLKKAGLSQLLTQAYRRLVESVRALLCGMVTPE